LLTDIRNKKKADEQERQENIWTYGTGRKKTVEKSV